MFIRHESGVTQAMSPPVIVTQNTRGYEEAAGVRPGDGFILGPPPGDHNTEKDNRLLNKKCYKI